jgi:putative aldouronate transport system permease protein
MNELWSHRRARFYQSVMFLPYFISWIVISYIVYAFFNGTTGYVNNSLLTMFGIKNGIEWYSLASKWPPIIIFFHLWRYTGYNLIVYVASIAGISGEYYEAAAIDGATKFQQIRYITIPMLKTTMVILSLIAVGRIFNGDFDLFYNVPRNTGALFSTTSVIDTYVYNALQNLGDVSMSAAAGIYQAVVGCVIVIIANFAVRKIDKDSALF